MIDEVKPFILMALLGVFVSGCLASNITPKENVMPSIHTLSVVPIECPPLIFHPRNTDESDAIEALQKSASSPSSSIAPGAKGVGAFLAQSGASIVTAPSTLVRVGGSVFAVLGSVIMASEAAYAGREAPGMTAIIEMGQPSEIWTPTVEYAKTAAAQLAKTGNREIRMIDGYVKLPIRDRQVTFHMENWIGPIRRLHNSDVSTVDYSAIDYQHTDAILEVGLFNYEYYHGYLILQVFVRIVDPRTKQVLGRAKNPFYADIGQLAPLLKNDAEGLKRLILETGNSLLSKCLVDLGLISK